MSYPELLYKVACLRHAELQKIAALQRLLHTSKQQSCAVTHLARQLSFRLHHWVITISFTQELRTTNETYRTYL